MKRLLKSKIFLLTVCTFTLVCSLIGVSNVLLTKAGSSGVETTNATILSEDTHIVPIAMAADDNYTYPTLVSITSLMENSKKDTHYDIYIMTPGEFTPENKQKLLDLQEKNDNRCKITLIDMKNRYKDANDMGHITTPTYYRLSLSSLLPDLNKIIWLDGDTLIFEDLTDMLNLNMDGLYYRGFLDANVHGTRPFGVEDDHYICAGVMLINLEKLRQDNMEAKFETFIKENNEKLVQHDQTVINVLCHENIGILPAKYGIPSFIDKGIACLHAHGFIAKNRYTDEEMAAAYEKPAILHCICKPWGGDGALNQELWLSYAEKTGYIDEIKAKYGLN